MKQNETHQPDPGEGPAALAATSKPDSGNPQLSASEWRIIRNYRAMKVSGQGMLVDISEEFALAFPATVESGAVDAALRH